MKNKYFTFISLDTYIEKTKLKITNGEIFLEEPVDEEEDIIEEKRLDKVSIGSVTFLMHLLLLTLIMQGGEVFQLTEKLIPIVSGILTVLTIILFFAMEKKMMIRENEREGYCIHFLLKFLAPSLFFMLLCPGFLEEEFRGLYFTIYIFYLIAASVSCILIHLIRKSIQVLFK